MKKEELFNNKAKVQPYQRQPRQLGLYDAENGAMHINLPPM